MAGDTGEKDLVFIVLPSLSAPQALPAWRAGVAPGLAQLGRLPLSAQLGGCCLILGCRGRMRPWLADRSRLFQTGLAVKAAITASLSYSAYLSAGSVCFLRKLLEDVVLHEGEGGT